MKCPPGVIVCDGVLETGGGPPGALQFMRLYVGVPDGKSIGDTGQLADLLPRIVTHEAHLRIPIHVRACPAAPPSYVLEVQGKTMRIDVRSVGIGVAGSRSGLVPVEGRRIWLVPRVHIRRSRGARTQRIGRN